MSSLNRRHTPLLALALLAAWLLAMACGGAQKSPPAPGQEDEAAASETEATPDTGDTAPSEGAPAAEVEVKDVTSQTGSTLDADTIRTACEHYAKIHKEQSCDFGGTVPTDFAGCVKLIERVWADSNSIDYDDLARGAFNDCVPGAESCDDLKVCLDNI